MSVPPLQVSAALSSLSALSSESAGPTPSTMCLVCGKSFHSVWHMTRHLRTHTGERPFPCPFCPYRATQKNALQRHVQNLHHHGGGDRPPGITPKKKGPCSDLLHSSKITSFAALLDSHLLDTPFLDSRLLPSSSTITSSPSTTSSTSSTENTSTIVHTSETITTPSNCGGSLSTQHTNSLPSFTRALSNMISGSSWPSLLLSETSIASDLLSPNP
ncbi:Zinc finger protein [Armadillidium vulgare]|nr:Zinc finger protein [Armadillidium vulgare]